MRKIIIAAICMAGLITVITGIIGICNDDMIILKDYSELKYNRNNNGSPCYDKNITQEGNHNGELRSCTIGLMKELGNDNNGIAMYQSINTHISVFINDKFALHEIILNNIDYKNKKINIAISNNIGKEIIIADTSKSGKIIQYYWISNNNLIWMVAKNIEMVPDLLNDYQAKYPPTHVFSEDDFNIEKIFLDEITLKMDLIEKIDDSRDSINDAFEKARAIATQCAIEREVRCLAGLNDQNKIVTCPIAPIKDDSDRKKSWITLREQVKNMDPVLDNVMWSNPRAIGCKYDPDETKEAVRKALGISP